MKPFAGARGSLQPASSRLARGHARRYASRAMLTTAMPQSADLTLPTLVARSARAAFAFVGERLWLDFVNTESATQASDGIAVFDGLVAWLESAIALDAERAQMMRRRAIQQ